jgi:hypothetical protein
MPPKQEKTFEEKVWHIIAESSNDRGGGSVLRVMSWIVDGKMGKPCIDKRDWWMTEDNEKRVGKAKGLTGYDLLTILRTLDVVAKALQIPAEDIRLALDVERKASNNPETAPETAAAGGEKKADPWG